MAGGKIGKLHFKYRYLFIVDWLLLGRNKYLYPSQKQMMSPLIDFILPGTQKKEKRSEGFQVVGEA